MVDTNKLREAVTAFEFYSRPSNADSNAECKNKDLQKVINSIGVMMNAFIDELEQKN